MKRFMIVLSLFCCRLPAVGQLPSQLTVSHYNETNGISNGRVTAMLQATNGYLWFGTTNGLLRYDGYQFKQFNSPVIVNAISKMAEDSSHCIWMSFLGGGLARFNPANGEFNSYMIKNSKDASIATAEISKLFFDSKGQLWIGVTQKGLVKADIKNDRFTVHDIVPETNSFYTPEFRKIYNTVYDIYEDGNIFWLATHDGLYKFNPASGSMQATREKSLEKNSPRLDLFGHIVADNDLLWFSSWGGGIVSYNKKNSEWKMYLPNIGPHNAGGDISNVILTIAKRNDHELWVGNGGKGGLGIFNTITKSFYFFSNNSLYPNIPIADWTQVLVDKDESVWSMNRNGLLKMQAPNHKFSFNNRAVSNNAPVFYLSDILEDEHYRFTGTLYGAGLYVYDKASESEKLFRLDVFPTSDQDQEIRKIIKDSRGNVWIVSRDFIYRYDFTAQKPVKIKQPPAYSAEQLSNSFTGMAEDQNGRLWISTKRNGIFVYDVSKESYLHYSNTEAGNFFLNAANIFDVTVDKAGRVWAAGPYGYLGYTDSGGKFTELKKQTAYHPVPVSIQTYSLFSDSDGNIWAGTFNGLYLYDCSAKDPVLKKIITASDGLRSNLVSNMQEDETGNIWCITEAGVCCINRNNYKITSYHAMDGISSIMENIRITKSYDGQMRLLTAGGFYSFDHTDKKAGDKNAPLLITGMKVNDKDYYFEDVLKKEGRITLSPSQNVFSFEFAAIDFNRPDKQRYSYMLKGFDENWIDAGNRRFVSYTNLSGGHYTFLVRHDNGTGIFKTAEISIPVFIRTPFYKTPLFFIALVLIIAAFLYWLYRNRVDHHRQLHKLESKAQLLEKEKAMVMYEGLKQQLNPHFLFNSLTSLGGLIQTNQAMAGNFLDQMSKIYRYILQNRDHETVTLSQELKFLESYVQLQKTRFGKGLQVNIDIDDDLMDRKIAPVTLQNLTENAIKHNIIDQQSPLMISITCDENYLTVENNLQKKDFVETSNKQGLVNMKALYKYLTGKPVIIEENDQTFTIKIPLV